MAVTRQRLMAWGALAAVAGGACWAVKAAAIMLTGVQPPVIYDVAPLFFPVAVVGLWALLDAPRPRSATIGLALACVAELAAAVSVVGLFLGPPEWSPRGDTVTVLTPFITVAGLATLAGLLLLGLAVRRSQPTSLGASTTALVLAVSTLPLTVVGAILEGVDERLFEAPTLALGLVWVALGVALTRSRGRGIG